MSVGPDESAAGGGAGETGSPADGGSRVSGPGGPSTPPGGGELPDVAYAVAIAAFRDMTPVRLRLLLDGMPARDIFTQVRAGDPGLIDRLATLGGGGTGGPRRGDSSADMEANWGASGSLGALERGRAQARALLRTWRAEASRVTVARHWDGLLTRGIRAVRRGDPGYPERLLRARAVPELLYVRGGIDHAAAPCVGIVGTRRATHYGLEIASELGQELAQRGIVVVSGLARGIDAAAHRGVLAATDRVNGPLAVVGGGVDVVFPQQNRRLWDDVIEIGGLMSEAPPGAAPEGWRFPQRNRIIAALSQVLVVVESSRQGGAIHTVLAANSYGVPILAVPGSVRSPQSEGTNAIIQEGGAHVVLDVHDVLAVLDLVCAADGTPRSCSGGRPAGDPRKRIRASWDTSSSEAPAAGAGEADEARRAGPNPTPGPNAREPETRAGPPAAGGVQQSLDIGSAIGSPIGGSAIGGSAVGGSAIGGGTASRSRQEAARRLLAGCSPIERAVCATVDYTPTMLERVCIRTGLDLGVVALAIDRLEELGLVRAEGPSWVRV